MALNIVKSSKYISEKLLAEVAEEVFSFIGQDYEVRVKFACEECIRRMNKEYRGQDKPTNVLSFNESPDSMDGDIVICEAVVEQEAAALGYAPKELDLLYLTHGMLHLAGFDHVNDTERAKMEAAEGEILKRVGIIIER